MDLTTLQQRADIIKQVRAFFDNKNYLSLDTSLLQENLIPESCLEVFETTRIFPHGSREKSRPLWLIPSPEISMKKIIAQHKVNVYQICKCFRNGESAGHLHNSEFTMLEYYTMGATYLDSLLLTEELFAFLIGSREWGVGSGKGQGTRDEGQGTRDEGRGTRDEGQGLCTKANLDTSSNDNKQQPQSCACSAVPCPLSLFERITVAQAFERWAGFDLFAAAENLADMETQAHRLGLDPPSGLSLTALYDLIFIHAVEPHLKTEKPIALLDYPAFVPCLAKKSKDGKATVERWELYYNGIELANCFSEETEPQKIKEFFLSESAEKGKNALVKHNIDHNYWEIFNDFPCCSGVAMGLDRLVMALTGKTSIERVLP